MTPCPLTPAAYRQLVATEGGGLILAHKIEWSTLDFVIKNVFTIRVVEFDEQKHSFKIFRCVKVFCRYGKEKLR